MQLSFWSNPSRSRPQYLFNTQSQRGLTVCALDHVEGGKNRRLQYECIHYFSDFHLISQLFCWKWVFDIEQMCLIQCWVISLLNWTASFNLYSEFLCNILLSSLTRCVHPLKGNYYRFNIAFLSWFLWFFVDSSA